MPDRYTAQQIRETIEWLRRLEPIDGREPGTWFENRILLTRAQRKVILGRLQHAVYTEEALAKLSTFVEEVGCDDRRDRPYQYVGAEMRNLGLWRDPQLTEPRP